MNIVEILANLQTECDKLYNEFGATDNIIQLQVAINSLRNEYDVCDKKNLINPNEGFVQ